MTAAQSEARPRIAARALILHHGRLLIVNAYPTSEGPDLWCAPGGGLALHNSLHDTMIREVHEETGLKIVPGPLVLVNEFHDPEGDFHQIDLFFRAMLVGGTPGQDWDDPEGVVTRRRWVTRTQLIDLPHRPEGLAQAAWGYGPGAAYDPLEPIIR